MFSIAQRDKTWVSSFTLSCAAHSLSTSQSKRYHDGSQALCDLLSTTPQNPTNINIVTQLNELSKVQVESFEEATHVLASALRVK